MGPEQGWLEANPLPAQGGRGANLHLGADTPRKGSCPFFNSKLTAFCQGEQRGKSSAWLLPSRAGGKDPWGGGRLL